jgi:hypothetical protein
MTTKFTFDINDLNIPWTAGGSYTVSIQSGFVKEVGNNRSPSAARPNIFSLTTNRPAITGGNTLGATNVFSATAQTLVYDSVVFANTGVRNLYLYRNGSPDVLEATIASNSARYSFSEAAKTITLDLSNLINGDESYYIRMDADFVTNVFGLTSAAINNEAITFTTGARPTVTSTAPVNNSINNFTSTVQLNYNRAVDLNTGNYYLLESPSNTVLSTVSTSSPLLSKIDADSIRMNFYTILNGEKTYHVRSDADIVKDQFNFTNRAVNDDSMLSFGTGLKPFVASTIPSNANNFVMTTTFSLVFNTPITKHETPGNIYVYRDSTPDFIFKTIPVSSSTVSVSGNFLTVADNWAFTKGEVYYVTFDADIVRNSSGFTNNAETSEEFMKFTMGDIINTSSFIFQSTSTGDRLGSSISISNNYMLFGAPGSSTSTGSVYGYDVRTGNSLGIQPGTGAFFDAPASIGFGHSISAFPETIEKNTTYPYAPITGDNAWFIGGAPFSGSNTGKVIGGRLTQSGFDRSLDYKDPRVSSGDRYGQAVTQSYYYYLIGAPGTGNNKGRVYRSGKVNRPQPGDVIAPDEQFIEGESISNEFGFALETMDDGIALGFDADWFAGYHIISAPGHNSQRGKVYVYKFEHGISTFTLERSIVGTLVGGRFGSSLSRSGDNILIGAPGENKAYIYNLKTGALVRTFTAINGGNFGTSVALKENFAVVGAPDDLQFSDQGKVYYYDVTTGEIVYVFSNPNIFGVNNGEKFGQAVAFENTYDLFNLAIGAPFENFSTSSTSTGVVYLYQDPELYQRPTVTVTGTTSSMWQYQTDTVTFTISEPVDDFTVDDILTSGITLTNFTGTGAVYSATVRASDDTFYLVTGGSVRVRSQKFSNSSGYNIDGTDSNNSFSYSLNNLPTFTMTASSTQLDQGQTATITITGTRGSLDVTTSTFTATGGTISNVQFDPASGDPVNGYKIWTADFTVTVAPGSACSLIVFYDAFHDAIYGSGFRGTTNTFQTLSFTLGSLSVYWDTAQDTGVSGDRITNANPIIIRGTAPSGQNFNLSVGGYNFSQGIVERADGYNFTLTTTLLGNGVVTPIIASANYGSVSGEPFTIDRLKPTATLTAPTTSLMPFESVLITITSSEQLYNLTTSSFRLNLGANTDGITTNLQGAGTISDVTAVSGNTWTVLFTRTDVRGLYSNESIRPYEFFNRIELLATGATDAAGNTLAATYFIDIYSPETVGPNVVSITSTPTNIPRGGTSTIAIVLSEVTTDFTLSDVTATWGSLSNFSGTGTNYTMTYTNNTPNQGFPFSTTITVVQNAFTNIYGYGNAAFSKGFNFTPL